METDRILEIETELTFLHTLLDMLQAKEISPDEAARCYQDYLSDQAHEL